MADIRLSVHECSVLITQKSIRCLQWDASSRALLFGNENEKFQLTMAVIQPVNGGESILRRVVMTDDFVDVSYDLYRQSCSLETLQRYARVAVLYMTSTVKVFENSCI